MATDMVIATQTAATTIATIIADMAASIPITHVHGVYHADDDDYVATPTSATTTAITQTLSCIRNGDAECYDYGRGHGEHGYQDLAYDGNGGDSGDDGGYG